MNTMDTRNFIDKVRKGLSKEYITELVDSYLLSEIPANTLNAFDNIIADASLASYPDRRMCESILSRLLKQHISAGGDVKSFSDIITSNPSRITFNANLIKKNGEKAERTNKFSIAVSGTNLFAVLSEIFTLADTANYAYDIDIPIMQELDQGIIETISLYCPSNKLEDTLNFINSFSEELRAKFAPNNSKAMLYTPSISYDSFNAEAGKWGKTVVGEALVVAIDNVISEAVESASIQVSLEDAKYSNNEHDMTASYLFMKEKFEPAKLDFYQLVADHVKKTLKSMDIDASNIYMPKSFIKNLYLVNHASPQVVSPTGFVANQVIKAKPAAVSFEQTDDKTGVLGEDDIPDLPQDLVPMGEPSAETDTLQTDVVPSAQKENPLTNPVNTGLIKGPQMMLVPEMLERHHNDTDLEGLYQTFLKIKNSEAQISAKILQLNQVWPDLTYADFVAFRQYDKVGDFISDGFIQLWVDTKQNGATPTISSEELYKEKSVLGAPLTQEPAPVQEQTQTQEPAPVQEQTQTQAPAPVQEQTQTQAPAPVQEQTQTQDPAPVQEQTQTQEPAPVQEQTQIQKPAPVQEAIPSDKPLKVVATRKAPANMRTSKTERVMKLIIQGPQAIQEAENIQINASPSPQPQVSLDSGETQGTGMYTETPVDVQPLENQNLSQAEAQAMMQVGNNTLSGVDLQKYAFFPNAEITLAQPVVDLDGATITLYNYLEKYNVLGTIPRDATVTTPDGVTTSDEFIVNNLSRYVITNGAVGVEEYLEMINASINAKETKKGFLGKFLNKRK